MKELKEIEALDAKLKEKHWFINAFLSEKADIEVWEQKIKNLEIEIACFEELALNWQKKYDTEVFDQERKRLNTDNKTESVSNLHKNNELESKVHDLQDRKSVEQIQQELNLMSHEEFDKLVSIELDKENQRTLETLLEMLKKINEEEK